MILKPGNIWSGSKSLAVFTNPTELARRKGNLKNSYPVTIDGVMYVDIEQWFFAKLHVSDSTIPFDEKVKLVGMAIAEKLKQHPRIREVIRDSGGVEWLEQCSHHVNGGRWEGDGEKSAFIRALIKGYEESASS